MKPRSPRPSGGFTLIEILIVIVIIGAMMGLGVSVLFPGNEAKLRDSAARLAGTIKFLYNEAAIKKKYYRLVFDLDSQSYSVESSSEPFLLQMIEKPEPSPQAGAFTEESGFLVENSRLPSGIKIKDISVLHLKDRRESGKVFIAFFPNGYVEPAVINLADEDEAVFYSLEVSPLTGRTKIRSEYYEVRPEELRPRNGGGEP
ncbi:MAG TPA: hypothetical protein DF383_00105 [Deltaproteobacteria bacterium]|nr:hypothetical protein [Deltaproteobacteria bacterium]